MGPDDTGLGSAEAGYQLAPLQYLYGPGPVLFHNGQEVGEPGAGREGYGGEDGRTTLFDYWSMPEFAKWVNGHAYDGGGLDPWQRDLRRYYADLLALCQDPAVRADGYWGLKYFNRPDRFADCPADLYSYARFEPGSGRLLVVVANFRGGAATEGRIRIPEELADRGRARRRPDGDAPARPLGGQGRSRRRRLAAGPGVGGVPRGHPGSDVPRLRGRLIGQPISSRRRSTWRGMAVIGSSAASYSRTT